MSAVAQSFIKLDGITGPYATIIFAGLLGYLVWARIKINEIAWLRLMIVSAVVGHALSIVSLLAAELLLPDGIERLFNSASAAGLLQFFLAQLLFPFVLGGWLLANLAASSLEVMEKGRLGMS